MRILFVTHYFQPEPGFFVGLPFARELARRGHDVEVVTGFPNYPGGRLYPGYRGKVFMRETMDGIRVTRLPIYPSHDRSALRRTASYLSLAAAQSIGGPLVARPADVAFVVQGPASIGLPAVVLKWLRGVPFVFNIQDLWPDSLASTGMFHNQRGLQAVDRFCRFVYGHAARIVVIAPGMKQRLVQRGVPADRVEVVYNWCNEDALPTGAPSQARAAELGLQGKFNVLYAGNLGTAQALDAVLAAAALVKDDLPDVQFVLVGDGVEAARLREAAVQGGLHNVVFHPRMPLAQVNEVMDLSQVLLVHLRRDPLFAITVPSKTQAYLAAGKPDRSRVGPMAMNGFVSVTPAVAGSGQGDDLAVELILDVCQTDRDQRPDQLEPGVHLQGLIRFTGDHAGLSKGLGLLALADDLWHSSHRWPPSFWVL